VTCNSSSAFSASSAVKSNLENLFTARFARDRGGRRGEYYPSPQMDDPIPIRPSHPPPERSIALACEPKNMSVKKLVTIKILFLETDNGRSRMPYIISPFPIPSLARATPVYISSLEEYPNDQAEKDEAKQETR
jgi:hypothetical protein